MRELDLAELTVRATAAAQAWAPGCELVDLRSMEGGTIGLVYSARVVDGPPEVPTAVLKVAPPGLPPVRNRDVLRQARVIGALDGQPGVGVPPLLFTDAGDPPDGQWRVAGRRAPSEAEEAALRFAWIVCAHVKSNAIVLAQATATVGIGGGLPSRVDAVRLAVTKAGERARGAVMASDAFFPFADGLEVAAAAGVTAVVEPGGSVRDDEVIAAADRLGIALVFTGVRHFRH